MNYLAALGALSTALQAAGALAQDVPAVTDFVKGAVTAAEITGKSGPDKLTGVLNGASIVLNELPHIEGGIDKIETEVGQFVTAIVTTYHDAYIWVHKDFDALKADAAKLGIG